MCCLEWILLTICIQNEVVVYSATYVKHIGKKTQKLHEIEKVGEVRFATLCFKLNNFQPEEEELDQKAKAVDKELPVFLFYEDAHDERNIEENHENGKQDFVTFRAFDELVVNDAFDGVLHEYVLVLVVI